MLRHAGANIRWAMVVLGTILFLSMYRPNTWGGEESFGEHRETLREIDLELQQTQRLCEVTAVVGWWVGRKAGGWGGRERVEGEADAQWRYC